MNIKGKKFIKFLLANSVLLLFSAVVFAKEIQVYSYHIDPPFHLPKAEMDLSSLFIDELNQWQNQHKFTVVSISRPELNQVILSGQPYLILWANPLWFKSKDPTVKASENIFWDADVWVSTKRKPFQYTQPKDLIGKRIGGRAGYFYKGVTPLIKSGQIKAHLQQGDYENYLRLMSGDIETFVMSRSSFLYWQSSQVDVSNLTLSLSAHDAYKRHILFSQHYLPLLPLLNGFIESLNSNTNWMDKLNEWGVETLVDPIELELEELMDY